MRLFIHDYAGHPFQIQLSRELARRGHSVTHAFAGGLLTPRGSLQKKPDDPDALELFEVPMDANYRRDKYRFLRRRRMEIDYGFKLAGLIKEKKSDIVISANTPTEPQLRIANLCSQSGISFIPWIQDFYCVAVAKLARKKLPVIGNFIGWYHQLEKKTLQRADAIIVITEDFVPMLQELGVSPEKTTVIPNWAPLNELPVRSRRNTWSAAQGLDNKFVFLYSGTLAMKHNPEILWQLAEAFKDKPEVCVVVISEGPGAEYLTHKVESAKRQAPSTLRVLPFQSFSDMPDVLAAADVVLAILEADAGIFSVPSKVLTYHCAGRPILAAMPAGNLAARIIAKEDTGICVEPDDMAGFLKAARELRGNLTLRNQCGEKARAYAEENFDVRKIADRFEEVIGALR